MDEDITRLSAVLGQAIESGGTGALAAVMTDDAVVWHNTDHKDMDRASALAAITVLPQMARDVRIEVASLDPTPKGFVERYVMRGTVASHGGPIELHNCVFVSVTDGMITRIDEYVDPNGAAQFAPRSTG